MISVIIPTLNESPNLSRAVNSARALPDCEILIADGGSHDGTPDLALQLGCRLVRSPPGRALQMNAAARESQGDLLLFLHADCQLPGEAAAALETVLADANVGCGAFRHRIDSPRRALRVIETADNLRARWLQRPYGDQAIFVRRNCFEQVGGYPNVRLLEELLLLRNLRRITKFRLADATVISSARRWEQRGILATTCLNWTILFGAALRLPNRWLARLYYGRAPAPPDAS